ncbi:MAG: glycosyltransferase family 2 protein [Pirellulaceae bacterium]|nr:glycosyltransferase family 2 protein [Pirellulaceae bacterium]
MVVDDGSTDETPALLEEFARNVQQVRVVTQHNQGLTRALTRGCAEARGVYIARHDADDVSLPGRLAAQVELLENLPELAFVSCWSYGIGPNAELLFEVRRPTAVEAATDGLLERGEGPPGHGSVMFRADAYRQVGGYRAPFRYAQDWDLWLRLADVGRFACVPKFGYAYRVSESSISAFRRRQQMRLAEIARACHLARKRGETETQLLAEAACVSELPPPALRETIAVNSYFIGKCLLDRRDRRALPYLARSLRAKPWSVRRWLAVAMAGIVCREQRGSLDTESLNAIKF